MGNLSCSKNKLKKPTHAGPHLAASPIHREKRFVTVRYSKVPLFLRNGGFFESLEPNGSFDVPVEQWKADDSINSLDDFAQLLRLTTYWALNACPASVLDYCQNTAVKVWEDACIETTHSGFSQALIKCFSDRSSIEQPILFGGREFVDHWLGINDPSSQNGAKACMIAAKHGKLEVLKLLRKRGYPWDESVCKAAAEHGRLACLTYLHKRGCPWNASVCSSAAIRGHLTCLQYAHANGCVWDKKVTLSRYFRCLDYALQHGCPVHEDALQWATQFGRIDCLRILCAHGDGNQLYESLTEVAASNGQVETLKFLIQNGCPRHPFLVEKVLSALRSKPSLAILCLKYLVEEEGLFVDDRVFCIALLGGQFQCVQYLMDNGLTCNFVMSTGEAAHHIKYFDGFDLDECIMWCLQYISEHGATIDGLLLETIMTNPFTLCHSYIRDLHGFVPIKLSPVSGGEVTARTGTWAC